jgi:hypothetical protein
MRSGRWSLANLHAPAIKLAGTGAFAIDTQLYHLDYEAAYTAVMIDPQSHRLRSGALHYAIAVREDIAGVPQRAFTVVAEITLASDGIARIVVDDMHAYALDLATGIVTPA